MNTGLQGTGRELRPEARAARSAANPSRPVVRSGLAPGARPGMTGVPLAAARRIAQASRFRGGSMPMATLPLTRRSLIATLAGGAAVAIEPAALARLAAARAEDGALAPLVPRRLYFEEPERTGVRLSPKGMLAWLAPVDR